MLLSKWRSKAQRGGYTKLVKNSPLIKDTIPFKDLDRGVYIECCDCNLMHRFFKDGENLGAQPQRPVDYDYSWRIKAIKRQ